MKLGGIILWAWALWAWAMALSRRNKKETNPLEEYENNIQQYQKSWWNTLTIYEKWQMMYLWPDGIHGDIKQWAVWDCYLQAILVGLKNNTNAYIIFNNMISMKEGGYEVIFGRQLSLRSFLITQQDIANTHEVGYTGQLWDHIITRAYYRFRSDEAKSRKIKNPNEGTMMPDTDTGKMIFEGWHVLETYNNITWYNLWKKYNMSDWDEWSSMGTFSYHPYEDENYTMTPWIMHTSHAYIITSYDRNSRMISYVNPHDTSEKLQIHEDILLRLPWLALNYAEYGML